MAWLALQARLPVLALMAYTVPDWLAMKMRPFEYAAEVFTRLPVS